MLKYKTATLKASADYGTGTAIFSRFDGVPDKDGDITHPLAFAGSSTEIPMSAYGHTSWDGSLPPGKGVLRTDSQGAYFDFEFFNTTIGQDTRETVKALGPLQEWSYGFDILDSEEIDYQGKPARLLKALSVHEVSPVLRGAGNDTQTLAIKGYANSGRTELLEALKESERTVARQAAMDFANNYATPEQAAEIKAKAYPKEFEAGAKALMQFIGVSGGYVVKQRTIQDEMRAIARRVGVSY